MSELVQVAYLSLRGALEKTQYSKLILEIPDPDIAISMGCNVGCPFIGRAFDDNWNLEDPTGKSDEECLRYQTYTSVSPGLAAKPIVDIMVVLRSL